MKYIIAAMLGRVYEEFKCLYFENNNCSIVPQAVPLVQYPSSLSQRNPHLCPAQVANLHLKVIPEL